MLRRNIRLASGMAGLVLTGSLLGGTATAWADAVPGATPSAMAGSTATAMPTMSASAPMSSMPASASPTATATTARPHWCAGVTALERRIGREIRRLEAGSSTRGSMAWTRHHWQLSVHGHHAMRAQELARRMAWRRQLLGVLLTVQRELRWVANWCGGGTMPTAMPTGTMPTGTTASPGMGMSASPSRSGMPAPMPSAGGMNGGTSGGMSSGMNGGQSGGTNGGQNGAINGGGMNGGGMNGGSPGGGSMAHGPMSGGGAVAPTDPSMMTGRTGSHS
ncbi:hypothetical protein [Phaeacidiphilus oryzae]|uniref:hypothetical protein n=1 Tax=Phaeacidiphilus oryzae TaxID=348818 RepID=UPI00068C37F1|nr:hypothetical protein [Phaeacidiphilus oryzae]